MCPPFPCAACISKWQMFLFLSFQPHFISHWQLSQIAQYMWYPVTVLLIRRRQSFCETACPNISLHYHPCPDEGIPGTFCTSSLGHAGSSSETLEAEYANFGSVL